MNIRHIATVACVGLTLTFAGGGAAFADPGDPNDDRPVENCNSARNKQMTKGVMARGGPKDNQPGVTNCDHFYQESWFIGKDRNR